MRALNIIDKNTWNLKKIKSKDKFMEKNYVRVQIFEFVILVATIAGLFLWCRSESREDFRNVTLILEGIREDIKDFHGRLCTIEERTRDK